MRDDVGPDSSDRLATTTQKHVMCKVSAGSLNGYIAGLNDSVKIGLDASNTNFEPERVIASTAVTHIRYRIARL